MVDASANEAYIHNLTCFPYSSIPLHNSQNFPRLFYGHIIMFIICSLYVIVSTLRFFYYKKLYMRLQKRPVILQMLTTGGVAVLLISTSLHGAIEFPSVVVQAIRTFIIPLLCASITIKLIDFYNRYILAKALLEMVQAADSSNPVSNTQTDGQSENVLTRSLVVSAVWMLFKRGKIDESSKTVPNDHSNHPASSNHEVMVRQPNDGAVSLRGTSDHKKRERLLRKAIGLLKFLSSSKLYAIIFFILYAPYLINYLISLAKNPCFNTKYLCYGCPKEGYTITFIVGGIIVTVGLIFAFMVRKLPDPLGIVQETKYATLFGVIPALIIVIISMRVEEGFSKTFSLGWVLDFVAVVWQFISTDAQIYIAKRDEAKLQKEEKNRKVEDAISVLDSLHQASNIEGFKAAPTIDSLEQLLNNPQEVTLFEKHLVSEFAVETITMYNDCAKFTRTFFDMNENTRRARAKMIVKQHVDDDALLQVNLPFHIKTELIKLVNNPNPIPQTIFNGAQSELLYILFGSYLRYTNSDLFKSTHPDTKA